MSRTIKHQDIYDVLHGRKVSYRKKMKIYKWFDRVNFWDPDFKINYRKRKDWRHGGMSRIKARRYK